MKRFTAVCALGMLFLFGVSACNSSKNAAPAAQAQPPAAMPPVVDTLAGKVVETMNSGGYTYLSLEKDGKKTWVAIPQAKVKVGQQLACQPGMEMKNFTSKTLNRTFDTIFFSGGLR